MKIPSRRCDAMRLMNEIRALDPFSPLFFLYDPDQVSDYFWP